jgi:phosphoribosyl 1,2-cyclic phosphodiesterase
MLINGKYPPFLKQRILSDKGHLSNIDSSSFIKKNKDLNFALLAHLSANNNTPEKARVTFETIMKHKVDYSVLSRDKESGTWEL